MRRVNILITEDYTTKKVAATKFTAPGDVPVFDCSIHFGKEGDDVTLQNCTIQENILVKCSPEDTYDFEVGALIALIKMCGRDKVIKACDELYKDDNNEKLIEENNHLKYIKSCNESTIKSLEDTNETLKKEKEQIIVAKNVLYNKLEKERDLLMVENDRRLKDKIDLKEKYVALKAENEKLKLDCEKLQHEYDLCKNSENALKCSVDYLNKTIAKLNTAIDGYKEDLYKVTKRCEELDIKESTLNKQQEQLDKREEKISVYFGGRGCGKQYKALVALFKKLDQKKVDAAYKEAYNTTLPVWQKEVLKQMYNVHKETKEWLYRIPTKRDEMWAETFELHKKDDVIIKVKKEDVNTFLHEIEKRFPEITWLSGVKIFKTKYTIGDIYKELKTCDEVYFRLWKETKLTYSCDSHIHPYRNHEHIAYLPPMRWDLFKKGRIVVGVKNNYELEEFRKEVERNTGIKDIPTCPTNLCLFYSFDKDNYKIILETIEEPNIAKINGHKVYYWEDVREKTTSMEDPYDTWVW